MDQHAAAGAGRITDELGRRLQEVERAVDPGEIAELWVFPPLPEVESSAEFVLFTRFAAGEHRRLYSARMPPAAEANGGFPAENGASPPAASGSGAARGNGSGSAGASSPGAPETAGALVQEIVEHGSVPADRMPRLIERFLRRLGEDEEPVHLVIDGRQERWQDLLRAPSCHGHGAPGENGRNGRRGLASGPGP